MTKVVPPDMGFEARPAVSTFALYASLWRYAADGRARHGERLIEAFESTRRMIAPTEAKWCAVDLLTVACRGCSSVFTSGACAARLPPGHRFLLGGVFIVYQYARQAGGVIDAMGANMQNFSRFGADNASAEPNAAAHRALPAPETVPRTVH